MNDKLRQQFDEQLTYLPEINQAAMRSFDWATELISIGHGYGLHVDQLEDLQIETMLVMVGLTAPEKYEDELITRLALSPTEANRIIDEVNKRIFTPIHDYIVRGGPEKPAAPTSAMESAGMTLTTEETPINLTDDVLVRMGGSTPTQSIPETKPTVINPTNAAPLQFTPNTATDVAPITINPVSTVNPGIQLSREKLEKMVREKQQVIDATIQSMDQV
jgi:hypothetical protein